MWQSSCTKKIALKSPVSKYIYIYVFFSDTTYLVLEGFKTLIVFSPLALLYIKFRFTIVLSLLAFQIILSNLFQKFLNSVHFLLIPLWALLKAIPFIQNVWPCGLFYVFFYLNHKSLKMYISPKRSEDWLTLILKEQSVSSGVRERVQMMGSVSVIKFPVFRTNPVFWVHHFV